MGKYFTLPISPSYVSEWGLWQAVREIIQNAYDQQTLDPECKVEITCNNDDLRISTSKGTLSPSSLILGNTTKADDPEMRGKFGEGYKLALLVLTRLGHTVTIFNGDKLWLPKVEHSKRFETEVLNIHESEGEHVGTGDGVTFSIHGVTSEMFFDLMKNVLPPPTEDMILTEPEMKGKVFVGGLFVRTMKDFCYGYNFLPASIKLDRDRGMVCEFDLSYLTSKLWTVRKYGDEAYKMLQEKAPDVRYVDNWTSRGCGFSAGIYGSFRAQHGDAVPVSTQDEIERATKAGRRWVLVPESIKKLVGKVISIFLPSFESPVDRLKKFAKKHHWSLDEEARQELADIISKLEGKVNEPVPQLQA